MGNAKNEGGQSRRGFFAGLFNSRKEKIKLLTAEGKLVEIDKDVLDTAVSQKVNNKEILQWMKNPSKGETDL
jgi:hypothetical protein